MEMFDCIYVTAMLKYAPREYLTASKNHVVLSMMMRV
jgi:hypothetical protein